YSLTTVQRFVAHLRREEPSPTGRPRTALTKPKGPTPRHVVALILQRPERRTDEQRAYLAHLSHQAPTIATATTLADDFLVMLRRREGDRLPLWLDEASRRGVQDPHAIR